MKGASVVLAWICAAPVLVALLAVAGGYLFNVWEAGSIRDDEQVVLFPSLAHLAERDNEYVVHVKGRVFEEEAGSWSREIFLYLSHRLLRFFFPYPEDQPTQHHTIEDELFRLRAAKFWFDNEGGKRITVHFAPDQKGEAPAVLSYAIANASTADGHFSGEIRFSRQQFESLFMTQAQRECVAADGSANCTVGGMPVNFYVEADDGRRFHGKATLVGKRGHSIISDIDDTIKLTNVPERREMFSNSFLKDFTEVKGMSKLYNSWATKLKKEGDVAFHYVSASPWEIFPFLHSFLHEHAKFPEGTWHLHSIFKDWETFRSLVDSPMRFKLQTIEPLLQAFPHRKFVLVGDDGQHDPEIYAIIAKEHPEQVSRIFIHHVNETEPDGYTDSVSEEALRRCERVFSDANVPRRKWTLFADVEIESLLSLEL